MRKHVTRNSYLTVTDLFCGAGGSSQGARSAGAEVKIAANHWKQAADDYVVLGNEREQVKQYGNAVTPPVMEMLFQRVAETLR